MTISATANTMTQGYSASLSGLLTAKEAARYLHISLFTLNKIARQGYIVPFRTPGGHRRYSLDMLNDYLQASRGFKEPVDDVVTAGLEVLRDYLQASRDKVPSWSSRS